MKDRPWGSGICMLVLVGVYACNQGRVGEDAGSTSDIAAGAVGGVARSSGNSTCFEAGSLVATPHGSVPIERLAVGDTVRAFDERLGQVLDRRVTATFVHEVEHSGRLTLTDGRELRVTGEHPIYEARRGAYVRADELKGNESLVTLTQSLAQFSPTRQLSPAPTLSLAETSASGFVYHRSERRLKVYNISVEGLENYFVEGVLVHNKSGGPNVGACENKVLNGVTCERQSRCLDVTRPAQDHVTLNQPVDAPENPSDARAPVPPVDSARVLVAPVCPNPPGDKRLLLAMDYHRTDASETPGFAVYSGNCSGRMLGEVWFNDEQPPPPGSITTQCVNLYYVDTHPTITVQAFSQGDTITNLRAVSSCDCARSLTTDSSCGAQSPSVCQLEPPLPDTPQP